MVKLGKKFDKIMDKIVEQVNGAWEEKYPEGRDEDRIDLILAVIRKIWKEHPELRLCQLIGNCVDPSDNYYKEDDELYINLVTTYLEKKHERA